MVVLAPSATNEYFNWLIGWTSPTVAQCTLLYFEGFRTLPGEARMYTRLWRRGRINIVELLFILIKYLSLFATITSPIQEWTTWLNSTGCLTLSWIQQMGMMLCTTLVTSTLAWRCYIIFQRNRTVGLVCLVALSTHLFLAIFTCEAQAKYDITRDGYCAHSPEVLRRNHGKKWFQLRGSWFVLISAFMDTAFVLSASWRLVKYVRGPTGLQRIGRLLFLNNMHYLAIISTLNFAYFWVLSFLSRQIPPLLWLIITIQVIVSMQMLISEQDEAHGSGSRPTHSTMRAAGFGGAGASNGGGRGGSSFALLKSGSNVRSHTTSATTTLTQQQTITPYNYPLEGIRFDDLHESIVVDATMTQLRALEPTTRPLPPRQDVDRASHLTDRRVAPWEYQQADGSSIAYANEDVPLYSAPTSRDPFVDASRQASSDKVSSKNGPSHTGLSIKAIRANMENRQEMPRNDPTSHDTYAMRPMTTSPLSELGSPDRYMGAALDADRSAGGSFAPGDLVPKQRKRTDSLASNGSACTCGRASISYGTALTKELTYAAPHEDYENDRHDAQDAIGNMRANAFDLTVTQHDNNMVEELATADHEDIYTQRHSPSFPYSSSHQRI